MAANFKTTSATYAQIYNIYASDYLERLSGQPTHTAAALLAWLSNFDILHAQLGVPSAGTTDMLLSDVYETAAPLDLYLAGLERMAKAYPMIALDSTSVATILDAVRYGYFMPTLKALAGISHRVMTGLTQSQQTTVSNTDTLAIGDNIAVIHGTVTYWQLAGIKPDRLVVRDWNDAADVTLRELPLTQLATGEVQVVVALTMPIPDAAALEKHPTSATEQSYLNRLVKGTKVSVSTTVPGANVGHRAATPTSTVTLENDQFISDGVVQDTAYGGRILRLGTPQNPIEYVWSDAFNWHQRLNNSLMVAAVTVITIV